MAENHKITTTDPTNTNVKEQTAIRCSCGWTSAAFGPYVKAVVQRHVQIVKNDFSLEIK